MMMMTVVDDDDDDDNDDDEKRGDEMERNCLLNKSTTCKQYKGYTNVIKSTNNR